MRWLTPLIDASVNIITAYFAANNIINHRKLKLQNSVCCINDHWWKRFNMHLILYKFMRNTNIMMSWYRSSMTDNSPRLANQMLHTKNKHQGIRMSLQKYSYIFLYFVSSLRRTFLWTPYVPKDTLGEGVYRYNTYMGRENTEKTNNTMGTFHLECVILFVDLFFVKSLREGLKLQDVFWTCVVNVPFFQQSGYLDLWA